MNEEVIIRCDIQMRINALALMHELVEKEKKCGDSGRSDFAKNVAESLENIRGPPVERIGSQKKTMEFFNFLRNAAQHNNFRLDFTVQPVKLTLENFIGSDLTHRSIVEVAFFRDYVNQCERCIFNMNVAQQNHAFFQTDGAKTIRALFLGANTILDSLTTVTEKGRVLNEKA
jgi:hypothetical protein